MRTMRVAATGALFLSMCGWLESPCGTEELLTIAPRSRVESFEIRDSTGTVIWHIETTAPKPIESLRLGRVPPGFVQSIPSKGGPREFLTGEHLIAYTVAQDHTFLHKGTATGPRSFCGGFYESTEHDMKAQK